MAMIDTEEPSSEVSGIFRQRGKLLIALALLIVALGYFGFIAFKSATVYYLTVGELREQGPSPDGKLVRVNGTLVPGSYQREVDSPLVNFALTDGTDTLKAVYSGVVPDLFFNDHSEIILEGTYTPRGVFETQTVIVKCPSKYIAPTEET